jgi:hypothetical protein
MDTPMEHISQCVPLPLYQGLTLVHFSAQPKRFMRDRGCI